MTTLQEALDWFYVSMEGVKAPATVVWYQRRLKDLVAYLGGDIELSTITEMQLCAWRAGLAHRKERWTNHPTRPTVDGGLSQESIRGYVRAVRTLFGWFEKHHLLITNPARLLEMPPLPQRRLKGLSLENRLKIIESAANTRDRALLLFLGDTGCRECGVAGLRMRDLELDRGRATVWEKGLGGKKKSRTVFMAPRTVDAMRAWLKSRPYVAGNDRVFIGLRRQRVGLRMEWRGLTEGGVYLVVKRAAELAKVESGWNPHNWRHGTIRTWLDRGMPLSKASELAGHSSTKVTGDIYGTSNDDELESAHNRYGWVEG